MKKFMKRLRSDRGDSELISLMLVIPIVFGILFTMIDASLYFQNRSAMQGMARDAARSAAIMGGDGNGTKSTPIEKQYGQNMTDACTASTFEGRKHVKNIGRVSSGYSSTYTSAIECSFLAAVAENRGLFNVDIDYIVCSPDITTSVGQKVTCESWWIYTPLPGSGLKFIGLPIDNFAVGSSNSEVKFAASDLKTR